MSLDEEITLVRSTHEVNEAMRAYAALECVFNSPGPASSATAELLSELRETLQLPADEEISKKSSRNVTPGSNKKKNTSNVGFACIGVVLDPNTNTLVLPSERSKGPGPSTQPQRFKYSSPPPSAKSAKSSISSIDNIGDVDEQSSIHQDEHNENCEVCNLGGELLCCDTCSLVFHPACVRPPLPTIPKEDKAWSCAFCVLDGTVKIDKAGYSKEAATQYVRDMKLQGEDDGTKANIDGDMRSYRGVVYKGRRYRAQIQINGKQLNLGKYNTAMEAAKVYDLKARKAFGVKAKLNFPRSGELGHFNSPVENSSSSNSNSDLVSPSSKRGRSLSRDKSVVIDKSSGSSDSSSTDNKARSKSEDMSRKRCHTSLTSPSSVSSSKPASKRGKSKKANWEDWEDDRSFEGNSNSNSSYKVETFEDNLKASKKKSKSSTASVIDAASTSPSQLTAVSQAVNQEGSSSVSLPKKKGRGRGRMKASEVLQLTMASIQEGETLINIIRERLLDDNELRTFDSLITTKNRQVLESIRDHLVAEIEAAESSSLQQGAEVVDKEDQQYQGMEDMAPGEDETPTVEQLEEVLMLDDAI